MSVGNCAICGNELPHRPAIRGSDLLHGVPGEFDVYVCRTCGAGNTRPFATDDELDRFYPDEYGPHAGGSRIAGGLGRVVSERELRGGEAGAIALQPPGRLLDVGCGAGELGAWMIRRGWRVDGIEPSAAACERARARGVEARQGTLDSVELEPDAYDAVSFSHSLEHIGDPVAGLEKAKGALRRGGSVGISVPNFDSWARRRFGSEWFHLDLPRHRLHYTERSLRTLIECVGLKTARTWTTTSSTGLAGSIQYRRMGGLALEEGVAREALGQAVALALLPVASAEQRAGGGRDFLHALAFRPAAS